MLLLIRLQCLLLEVIGAESLYYAESSVQIPRILVPFRSPLPPSAGGGFASLKNFILRGHRPCPDSNSPLKGSNHHAVQVGGDGLFQEVSNGILALRRGGGPRAAKAPSIRLAQIPAGSTDAVAWTVNGTRSVETATLHVAFGDRSERISNNNPDLILQMSFAWEVKCKGGH